MNLEEIIKTRRSIRIFQDRKVEFSLIEKIIELATYAPSACNIQGWRFIIVEDEKIKQELVDQGGTILIKNAPNGILILYDNRTKELEYSDYIQSAAAAIQNIHLAAHSLGLGTCWLCHLPPKRKLRKIFNIPRCFSPIAYVLIGYKQKEPVDVPRKHKTKELIGYDEFPTSVPIEKISRTGLWIKRILIRIYHFMPKFIRVLFLNKYIDKKFVKKFEN